MADLEKKSGAPFHGLAAFPGAGGFNEEKGLIKLMSEHFPISHGNEYFSCHFDDAYDLVVEYCNASRPRFLKAEEARHSREMDSIQRQIESLQRGMEQHRKHAEECTVFIAMESSKL